MSGNDTKQKRAGEVHKLGRAYSGILNLLYPKVCPFCGEISREGICQECKKKIVYIRQPRCMRCGKPIKDEHREFCMDCGKRKSYITQGRSLWLHKEPVSTAIYKLKYKNKRSWGEVFAEEMAKNYADQMRKWEIKEILPIPLHKSRQKKRGYNQAEIVARHLSEKTGIPYSSDVLFRIKRTMPQKQLDRQERMENSKGAFAVSGRWKPAENVLLVDDIYTTGATVERAAKMLKQAGTQNVYFLTISIGQGI